MSSRPSSVTAHPALPIPPRLAKRTSLLIAATALAVIAGCGGSSGGGGSSGTITGGAPIYKASIQRTSFGVPHITATNVEGVAYGVGYAYAQDNFCLLADNIMTVNGERSRWLGPDLTVRLGSTLTNLRSDYFNRLLVDDETITALYANVSSEARRMAAGYAAGYNKYLRDVGPSGLPLDCRNAPWVRPITVLDMFKLVHEKVIQSSAGAFMAGIADATPPAPSATLPDLPPQVVARVFNKAFESRPQLGSNGYAFGRDVTDNGGGMLLGNPHFPWSTTNRFYQMHITVPGDFDVMGAALGGFPMPNIGFNNNVAWTHTVSTGRRFTLFELTLAAGGTSYVVDGQTRAMTRKTITVPVRLASGALENRSKEFFATPYGPIVVGTGLNWTATRAYALKDANASNNRTFDQWLSFARATNVQGMRTALNINGLPWVNTIAADRAGNALYADISVTPFVTQAKLAQCATSPTAQALLAGRTFVLDGSRAACDWDTDSSNSRQIFPPASMPALIRTDYLANSNDSAWLANPNALQTIPLIIGANATAQTLRTRMAFVQIADRLSGADGKGANNRFTMANTEQIFFDARVQAADMTMTSLLTLCTPGATAVSTAGNTVNLAAACDALRGWNRRMNFNATGAHVFREWWRTARNAPSIWVTPFSATDPVNTPRGLNVDNAATRVVLLRSLADAVERLNGFGISLTASLGSIQYSVHPGTAQRIPIDAGDEFEGTFNKMTPALGLTATGYSPIASGSSYIQLVSWDANGPVARGILTYGQSTDPASARAADQTLQYSTGAFVRLPFRQAEITADPNLQTTTIEE
jgi:acyl-homoserine-lactone acylase